MRSELYRGMFLSVTNDTSNKIFQKVEIKEKKMEKQVLIFEPQVGHYKNTPKLINKIKEKLLKEFAIKPTKGFGIFYDNPKTVSWEDCRSLVGILLEEADFGKIENLREKKFKVEILDQMDKNNKVGSIMEIYDGVPGKIFYIRPKEHVSIFDDVDDFVSREEDKKDK
ncbi:hypothetical protein M0811_06983 [Anaeramoeba ignava]|uniref:Uncharacterized protein n=1 Tax=Anaeramoeba ignava TaxID=1746090 RepID=A0A9Q0RD34_ANAIG|nr:hypothetical protein M0811_06983 [Anaeramoeba ignava]